MPSKVRRIILIFKMFPFRNVKVRRNYPAYKYDNFITTLS
jgi:hypothetical protein